MPIVNTPNSAASEAAKAPKPQSMQSPVGDALLANVDKSRANFQQSLKDQAALEAEPAESGAEPPAEA